LSSALNGRVGANFRLAPKIVGLVFKQRNGFAKSMRKDSVALDMKKKLELVKGKSVLQVLKHPVLNIL
jgi:hypothetical protein